MTGEGRRGTAPPGEGRWGLYLLLGAALALILGVCLIFVPGLLPASSSANEVARRGGWEQVPEPDCAFAPGSAGPRSGEVATDGDVWTLAE